MQKPWHIFWLGGILAILLAVLGCAPSMASSTVALPSGSLSPKSGADTFASNGPPPIFHAQERILFQGDATIDAGCWHISDLYPVFWQDYAYVIASEYGAAYPGQNLVFVNRSVSGDRVADVAARWQKDNQSVDPTVISIVIGVNNMQNDFGGRAVAVRKFQKKYDQMLASALAGNPQVKLILCKPFVYPDKRTRKQWDELTASLRPYQAAVDQLGVKYHVPVVDFQAIFNDLEKRPVAHDASSGVTYLTTEERQLMADEWVRVYQKFYGQADDPK